MHDFFHFYRHQINRWQEIAFTAPASLTSTAHKSTNCTTKAWGPVASTSLELVYVGKMERREEESQQPVERYHPCACPLWSIYWSISGLKRNDYLLHVSFGCVFSGYLWHKPSSRSMDKLLRLRLLPTSFMTKPPAMPREGSGKYVNVIINFYSNACSSIHSLELSTAHSVNVLNAYL